MKKLVLTFILVCIGVWGEDFKDSQWRGFFGIEAGVGLMDIEPAFLASFNVGLLDVYYLRGISYGGGILGGWQKYTSEKIGMRNTLGLRVFGTKDTKTLEFKYEKYREDLIVNTNFYYALDGLFDFVKNGDNHFGMSLGFSTDIFHFVESKGFSGGGFLLHLSSRLGFYTQFDNHIIDIILSVPLIGFVDAGDIAYNSTVTLGYKHLF